MAKALVYGEIVEGPGPVDPGFGVGRPLPPHVGQPLPPNQIWPPPSLPPLPPGTIPPPGMWPPQIDNSLPPDFPIVVPQPPEKPEQGPPPTVGGGPIEPPTLWPPLPPGTGIAGKCLVLIWVVGVGYRWLVFDKGVDIWPQPPVATPK